MKYLLLLLLLSGCTPHEPKHVSRDEWNVVYIKGPKYRPGIFEVTDKQSILFGCTGIVDDSYLNDDLVWNYFFESMFCGRRRMDVLLPIFQESQVKRIRNFRGPKPPPPPPQGLIPRDPK